MRLYELIDFTPKPTTRKPYAYAKRVRDSTKSSTLGVGSFASAEQMDSGKRLNQVTKLGNVSKFDHNINVVPSDIDEDGYMSYIRAIDNFNKTGKTNPYFPVIHNVRIMKDESGKMNFKVDLEKLHPFNTPGIADNEELMHSIFYRMFNSTETNPDRKSFTRWLTASLSNPNRIKDPKLAAALSLIQSVIGREGNFNSDIHGDNVMWRITGTIPQLVITDPVA